MSEICVTRNPFRTRASLNASETASLVNQALLSELRLTPKPGLVDLRNSGAHRDMDVASFECSTAAITPWMEKFWELGFDAAGVAPEQVLVMLRPVGMACEHDMLAATGGVNTHRGAIFSFGLLSAAAGRLTAQGQPIEQNRLCDQVARFCRHIVARELSGAEGGASLGETLFLRFGLTGARGEAESGFRTVRTQALPVFNRVLEQHGDGNLALLQTLLHLMAWNDDTRLAARGGLEGLYFVQQQAQRLLWKGGVCSEKGIEAIQQLDDVLISRHLSPGGSADLLAVTWFLSHFPAGALFVN
ncbi:triphosphoribosyl-dephospho-CoA synthase CitG [Entomohabitans teleogrylli]|uniref:triphosphoribosyl-dephospho-CoA synthase CitG n=1 Tax=Entomohabitans teleogrylli TaxID=1384589 RepID=UPI00073D8FCE|nr:triphosphoribosyl-dephospho-CoA synthase CitG [Entomohabitans teleogrylli]